MHILHREYYESDNNLNCHVYLNIQFSEYIDFIQKLQITWGSSGIYLFRSNRLNLDWGQDSNQLA